MDHIGSSFDDFLKEEGIFEICTENANKKIEQEKDTSALTGIL